MNEIPTVNGWEPDGPNAFDLWYSGRMVATVWRNPRERKARHEPPNRWWWKVWHKGTKGHAEGVQAAMAAAEKAR